VLNDAQAELVDRTGVDGQLAFRLVLVGIDVNGGRLTGLPRLATLPRVKPSAPAGI
jgi:hypothetical protein